MKSNLQYMRNPCSTGLREIRFQLLRAETEVLEALRWTRADAPPKAAALQLWRAGQAQARMERILLYAEVYFLESFFTRRVIVDMRKEQELSDPHSCLNRAEPYELIFTLLGRDAAAPVAIRAWIQERLRIGKNAPDDAQIRNAERCAKLMELERLNRK